MAEVVLFHHVQGLTDGVRAFADGLRAGGHTVHTPDLFEGQVAPSLEEGFAISKSIGEEEAARRLQAALDGLPEAIVYAGISWGVPKAQELAQTRPGAQGALFFESCIPVTGEWAFGPWPNGLPVQVHGMDRDPFFALEGDIDAARELVDVANDAAPGTAELFVYAGEVHLFLDSSLPTYDAVATELALQRSVAFLDALG